VGGSRERAGAAAPPSSRVRHQEHGVDEGQVVTGAAGDQAVQGGGRAGRPRGRGELEAVGAGGPGRGQGQARARRPAGAAPPGTGPDRLPLPGPETTGFGC
jgi:hypothetical protein